MAATGRRLLALIAVSAAALCHAAKPPDQSDAARRCLADIASALSASNPTDAMSPFAKSFAGYDTLSDYFVGLAKAFDLASEIDVTDEEDNPAETKLTVHWTLTLTDSQTNLSESRGAEIKVRLLLKGGKWKIVDFSPIALFDPQPQPSPRH